MSSIVAIDPGQSGGVAARFEDRNVLCFNMPETCTDFKELIVDLNPHLVIVENVGQYRPGNSGPAAVKFAKHVGNIEGVLVGLEIPHQWVAPNSWMRQLMKTLPKDKKLRKNQIKASMQALYPKLKVTLKTSDALGILTWYIERM